MADKPYKDTPSSFITGELKKSKTGSHYVWAKTFDLQKVISQVGSQYVNLKMVIPKNPKFEGERTFIFSPSERRMEDGQGKGKQQRTPSREGQEGSDDVIV